MGDAARGGRTNRAGPGPGRRRSFLVKLTAIVARDSGRLASRGVKPRALASLALPLALAAACSGAPPPPPPQPRPVVRVAGAPGAPAGVDVLGAGRGARGRRAGRRSRCPSTSAQLGRTPGGDTRWTAAPSGAARGGDGPRLRGHAASAPGVAPRRLLRVPPRRPRGLGAHARRDVLPDARRDRPRPRRRRRAPRRARAGDHAPPPRSAPRRREPRGPRRHGALVPRGPGRRRRGARAPAGGLRRGGGARAARGRGEGARLHARRRRDEPLARGAARLLGHVAARRRGSRRGARGMVPRRGVARGRGARARGGGRGRGAVVGRRRDGARARAGGAAALAPARLRRRRRGGERVGPGGARRASCSWATRTTRRRAISPLVAAARKLDLRNGDWFSNVAMVDRVRHAAARARESRIDDGSLGSHRAAGGGRPAPAHRRASRRAFRLVGPRATPDAELLQSLVFPMVGAMQEHEPPADLARRRPRDARRARRRGMARLGGGPGGAPREPRRRLRPLLRRRSTASSTRARPRAPWSATARRTSRCSTRWRRGCAPRRATAYSPGRPRRRGARARRRWRWAHGPSCATTRPR